MTTTSTPTPPTHPAPHPLQRSSDAAIAQSRGETAGESAPSQASPASRRHSPGESRRGGGPERQPTRQAAGEPQAGLLPTLYRPTEDGRPSHGLSWWAAPSTLPPGPGWGRARATGEYGAVSPAPSLRVRGPGKRRASSPAPAPITTPTPVQDRYSAPPSSSRIASGASHPRAHHVCALGAAAPASGKAGRRPGCEARPHDPYLGGDCPPVLLRAGLLEASPTWQGTEGREGWRGSGKGGVGGDAQLPSPPPPGPHSPALKWEDGSCPLPPPDTPATCPVPQRSVRRLRARGAEPATLQPRGRREPASGAPLAGGQSSVSSSPHPLCGGAGGGFPGAREAVAAQTAAARAVCLAGAPAVPPFSAGEAGASAERTAAAPAVPSPAGGWGCGRRPRAPRSPQPVLLPGAAAHLEAAPAAPLATGVGKTLGSRWSPGCRLSGGGQSRRRRSPPGASGGGAVRGPQRPPSVVSALRRDPRR
ncbi:hypothetical protein AB1E19_007617 [Capra hircus]